MTRYIKHLRRRCLTTFPNNSNFVKNTPLRVVISTFCSLFGNVLKHSLSCLVDYLKSDVVNGTNTDVQRIKCNLLHFEFTSEIFKIWITRKRLNSQKVLQTSSQNKTNLSHHLLSTDAFVSGGFAQQPCCTGKMIFVLQNIFIVPAM